MNNKKDKIFVAGHKGMVASAIIRQLESEGYINIITRSSSELDLRNNNDVSKFFKKDKPDIVFLAAAKVGGILANSKYPADFLYDNLAIQMNVIHNAYLFGVRKLCFLGSSCIYPRNCPQPMREDYLLTGKLEPTNEGYAMAKIAGIKLAELYHRQYGFLSICPMPCNLYGTNDNFDFEKSHVLSALVRKFVDAVDEVEEIVTIWGSGTPRREFMHVDDLSRALLFLMDNWHTPDIINVGCGNDVSIKELAWMVAEQAGFRGRLTWDTTKPDGMPRKCLDVTKLAQLGFKVEIDLATGIAQTIQEYRMRKSITSELGDPK